MEQEAVELDRERLQLADSVLARQRILSQVGLSPAHAPPSELSDSEFYSSNLLEVSLENSFSSRTGLNGTVGRFTDVSQMSQRTGSDDDDADDEDQSDLSDTGRLSSRDSFDFTANQNAAEAEALPSGHTATATAAEQAGHCYKCNDCAKISRNGRNRQSGSSDSGNVSDDSKITNSSLGDSFSFTDSAISSISSQETERKDEKNLSIIEQIEKSEKPQLWKRTESTDNESDVFNSREIYADQLRKNSQIIRQASVRKQKLIKPEKQVIESKIIETLVWYFVFLYSYLTDFLNIIIVCALATRGHQKHLSTVTNHLVSGKFPVDLSAEINLCSVPETRQIVTKSQTFNIIYQVTSCV